jgi:hypothetical protein
MTLFNLQKVFRRVDLPQPFEPMITDIFPSGMVRLRPFMIAFPS